MANRRPTTFRVDPAELGLAPATIEELRGGDASYNAAVIRRVVGGESSPHHDMAVLNAAASLVVIGKADDLSEGIQLARSVIDDGRAARVLEDFIRLTREAADDGR